MPAHARIIVTTYNQLARLKLALRGYLRQTNRDFNLVVADDGSTPDTGAYVKTFAAQAEGEGMRVEHVWIEDRGYRRSQVMNEAVRRGEGEPLLVFSDGDCIPGADFVAAHVAAHEPRSFHVGGAVRLSQEASEALTETDVAAGRHESLATPHDLRDLKRRARKSRWGMLLRRKNRPKVFGANLAVDRTLFEEINGYDERFVGWGLEDSDVRDRLMRLRPRPRVKILHGACDVYHLWHPILPGKRMANRAYYDSSRPIRCEMGLVRHAAAEPAAP